jgi:hypothetical protein
VDDKLQGDGAVVGIVGGFHGQSVDAHGWLLPFDGGEPVQ